MLDLALKVNNGKGSILRKHNFTWLEEFSYDEVAIALDNLERMGLINIPYGENYTKDTLYDSVRKNKDYVKYKKELENMKGGTVNETKKYINKTTLARSFFEVCMKE